MPDLTEPINPNIYNPIFEGGQLTFLDCSKNHRELLLYIKNSEQSGTVFFIDLEEDNSPVVKTERAGKVQQGPIIAFIHELITTEPLDLTNEFHIELAEAGGAIFEPNPPLIA